MGLGNWRRMGEGRRILGGWRGREGRVAWGVRGGYGDGDMVEGFDDATNWGMNVVKRT
jgi:hypothetical protein